MMYFSKIGRLYRNHIRKRKKEARFIILLSFTLTFITVRLMVYGIVFHLLPRFPFSFIFYRDIHIHHLVFGVIILLSAGLIRIPEDNAILLRFSSFLYGVGAALTLDEFALLLRLNPDAYFGPQGRISIDAVVLFILVTLSSIWYGKFWSKVFNHTLSFLYKLVKRYKKIFLYMKKKYTPLYLIGFIFLGIGIFALSNAQSKSSKKNKLQVQKVNLLTKTGHEKVLAAVNTISIHPTPEVTITVMPTVTSSPTATPVPSGFCLNIPVLLYHHTMPQADAVAKKLTALNVDNGMFDQQMAYIASHGFHAVSAEQLINALHDHTPLPVKSIVITVDDGYDDNYTYAYPTLKKYGLIATFMIPTGLLGIKTATNSYYTWDQLKEMVNSGVVTVGDHTWSHYSLGHGSTQKNQTEIQTGKQQLEQNLGKTVTVFAYPYGAGATIPWVIDLLKNDGLSGAYSTMGGSMQCDSYLYSLKRIRVGNTNFPAYGIY